MSASDPAFLQGGHRVGKRRSLGQSSVPAALSEPATEVFAAASTPPPEASAAEPPAPQPAPLRRAAPQPLSAAKGAVSASPAAGPPPRAAATRGEVSHEPGKGVAQTVRLFEAAARAEGAKGAKKRSTKPSAAASAPREPVVNLDRLSAVSVSDMTVSPLDEDAVSVDSLYVHAQKEKHQKEGHGSPSIREASSGDAPAPEGSIDRRQDPTSIPRDESSLDLELEEVLPVASSSRLDSFPLAQQVGRYAPTNLDVSHVTAADGHHRTHLSSDDEDDESEVLLAPLDSHERRDVQEKLSGSVVQEKLSGGVAPGEAQVTATRSGNSSCEKLSTEEHDFINDEALFGNVRLPSQIYSEDPSHHHPEGDHSTAALSRGHSSVIDEDWYERRRHETPSASTFAPHTPLRAASGHSHRSPQHQPPAAVPSPPLGDQVALLQPSGATPVRSAAKAIIDADEFEDEGGVPMDALASSLSSLDSASPCKASEEKEEGEYGGGVDPAALAADAAGLPAELVPINGLPRILAEIRLPPSPKDRALSMSSSFSLPRVAAEGQEHARHSDVFQPTPDYSREVGLRFSGTSRVIRPVPGGGTTASEDGDDAEGASPDKKGSVPLARVKVIPNSRESAPVCPVVLETPRVALSSSSTKVSSAEAIEADWKDSLRSSGGRNYKPLVISSSAGIVGSNAVKPQPVAASALWRPRSVPDATPEAAVLSSVLLVPPAAIPCKDPAPVSRRNLSPDRTKITNVSLASLAQAPPTDLPVIIAREEEPPTRRATIVSPVVPIPAVGAAATRRKILSPVVEEASASIAPPASTAGNAADLGEGDAAQDVRSRAIFSESALNDALPASVVEERKSRRMRNVQQALSVIDARYGAKAAEMQQRPPQKHSSGAAPTGHRAVDQLAQGLESVLRELKRTVAPLGTPKPPGIVVPHTFRVE
jgi:hypothetical protein